MSNILFTAPLDFDLMVGARYSTLANVTFTNGAFPTERRMLAGEYEKYSVWVCNPKANRVIDDEVLRFFPHLEILATPSTGLNHIDLDACKRRRIKVLSLLDDRTGLDEISASAEFTFKLLLDALRKPPARELQGKRVGIVGYGRIGQRVARYVDSHDADYFTYDPYRGFLHRFIKADSLSEIFTQSDAVVICCTYNKETHHMIDAKLLRSMKHGAALVNTSRGEVIDEYALAMVMEERPDLRVAVDVLEGEVTGTQNPQRLISRGAIVTPHIAGETYDSRTKAAKIILGLLQKDIA